MTVADFLKSPWWPYISAGSLLALVSTFVSLLRSRFALRKYKGLQDSELTQRDLERSNAVAKSDLDLLRQRLEATTRELESVEEAVSLHDFGVYRPRYGLDSSEKLDARLREIRATQKALIKDSAAATCSVDWTVDGNRAKGRSMVKQQMRLMLRAFNGECDAAIAKVKYNNAERLETRITKSAEAINRTGNAKSVSITDRYVGLKIQELHLVHEHRDKVQQEKDEQRQIKEQMREEEKAQKEIEKARRDAEKEERRNELALEKARRELRTSTGDQHKKLEQLVRRLETELKETLDRKAKAIARAQLTRSGHVYVISNIGAFGDNVYKIGMTRRLEPLDRVRELGGASVPFPFDVHAMIYSEDAPRLENALHREFEDRLVNLVNRRREFFRVSLDEIRTAVAKHHGIVTFVREPAAEQYRKSQATPNDNHRLGA